MTYQIAPLKRSYLEAFLCGACMVCSLLFFRSFSGILLTSRLLTSDAVRLTEVIILPVLWYALAIYFLLFAFAVGGREYPIFFLPIAFLLNRPMSLVSAASAGLILASSYLIFRLFFYSLSQFSLPTVAKSLRNCMGLSMAILSLAISISFYHTYYLNSTYTKTDISTTVAVKFTTIFTTVYQQSKAISVNDTLESYSSRLLAADAAVANPVTLHAEEETVLHKLGVVGSAHDTMASLVNKAVKTELDAIFAAFRSYLGLLIPLSFFFLIQIFSSTASNLAFILAWLTENMLRSKNIHLHSDLSTE